MDDARPVGLADAGDLGVAGDQAVHERAGGVAGAGVHDEAGRLVDTTTSSSSCTTVTHDGRVGHDARARRRRRRRSSTDVALGDAVLAAGHDLAADAHGAAGDEGGGRGAAAAGQQGDDAVEALAVQRRRHDLAHARHAVAGCAWRSDSDEQEPAADDDGDVGDVEHRPPLEVDEVDDRPPRKPSPSRKTRSTRLPSAPPSDQAEADRRQPARPPQHRPEHDDDDDQAERGR